MKVTFRRFVKPTDFNVKLNFVLTLKATFDHSPEYMHMNLLSEEILYDEIPFLIEFTWSNVLRRSEIHILKYQLDHI